MLDVQGLRYHPATAPRPLLDGVDLRLEAGAPVLVAGRSGSGKTTLLELLCGLASPDAGRILWNGDVVEERARRWLCGLVFQFPERHFLGLTVGQELRLGQRRVAGEAVQAVLERMGLGELNRQQPPEQLSGGQQRRLSLAVQLLRDPGVLLLDEPTAGLDWTVREEILQLLDDLARERAVLVVSHEPELFQGRVSQAWRLQEGRLVALSPSTATGGPEALRTMPPATEG